MKFGGIVDTEGVGYAAVLRLVNAYEGAGFQYAGVFDHFVTIYSDDTAPVLECWTTLAALARDTSSIRLGPLVTCSSYRHPVMVARMAANLADLSGGRHFLGVGLGWYGREFEALQAPMPSFSERLEQTVEFVDAVKSLLSGGTASFEGKRYRFKGASAVAPARREPIKLLIGSEKGGPKMLDFIAKKADIANIGWNMPLDQLEETLAKFDERCRAAGRDPSTFVKSANYDLLLGRDTPEFERRVVDTERKFRHRFGGMEAYREKIAGGLVGTPEECGEKIDRLKSMGVDFVFLQPMDAPGLGSLELFAHSFSGTARA